VCYEIKEVLFKIRPGAGYNVNVAPADHLGKGQTEFRGAHGSGKRNKHFSTAAKMAGIAVSGVH
jgi:hypothetical protein